MAAKLTNYTLPEWVFLDANAHDGDALEGRTVIQHIRSYTVIEVLALDEIMVSEMKTKPYLFNYKNKFGITEKHAMFVHFSLAEENELDKVIAKAIDWYCNYLAWEDNNIESGQISSIN